MRLIAFVDLDDSLFQTATKAPLHGPTTVRAVDSTGRPLSFSSPVQDAVFALLNDAGTVIPVTGRTDNALERVLLPFSSFRITHHGAMLRGADLKPTSSWYERIRPRLEEAQFALTAAAAALQPHLSGWGARLTTHRSEGLITYLSVKMNDPQAPFPVADWTELLVPFANDAGACRWLVHGRQAAVLPRGVGKREAVRILKAELQSGGQCLFLGLGDSLSDGPFLRTCDFCLVPTGSEIAALFGGEK